MTREKAIRNKADNRAFELDLLRGFAIFMMILHHFAYDLRYIFEYNVFIILRVKINNLINYM